jgi:hypothetical protein
MIEPGESSLVGHWVEEGGNMVADSTCLRIEVLVAKHLVRLATSPDGWATLYRDPTDGRLWERTFPFSHLHGGGPPSLVCISPAGAGQRYGHAT